MMIRIMIVDKNIIALVPFERVGYWRFSGRNLGSINNLEAL